MWKGTRPIKTTTICVIDVVRQTTMPVNADLKRQSATIVVNADTLKQFAEVVKSQIVLNQKEMNVNHTNVIVQES